VNEDCLKLTTYFGERDRTEHHLLADELLDLYGRHGVQSSVLLRGIAGFGIKHHFHTDRLLTLSEDLPVVSVAVDTRERIDALLPEVLAIKRRGLLTLERARLLSGEIKAPELPEELGGATKLTIYVGRQERVHRTAAFVAICDLLHRRGISGATVMLGVDGTSHGQRVRARFFARNAEVPMMIISVGPGEQIASALPELGSLLQRPLLTLERVRVCKRDGQLIARPHELPGTDEHGLAMWQKLMIHTSESAMYERQPLHRALVRRLRASNVVGATSLRGVWGFHGDHAPHGDKLLQVRRHVPVLTIVVDRPDRIAEAFPIVDEITRERGLVTSEMVPAATAMTEQKRNSGGVRLARHRF
jgi:PII-like signaling protein